MSSSKKKKKVEKTSKHKVQPTELIPADSDEPFDDTLEDFDILDPLLPMGEDPLDPDEDF